MNTATLLAAIESLDPSKSLAGVSYQRTTGNQLPDPWWVFIPYGKWADPPACPTPSPLEEALIWAISSASGDRCFIDIMHLDVANELFFQESQIAQRLANLINGLPADGQMPVIRYLIGNTKKTSPRDDGLVSALYSGVDGQGIVTHKTARIYFGNYAPDFHCPVPVAVSAGKVAFPQPDFIGRFWDWLADRLKTIFEGAMDILSKIETVLASIKTKINDWIQQLINILTNLQKNPMPVSWNHAKLFAINGSVAVAGGANYWNEYRTGSNYVFDTSMKVLGPASGDVHRFATYMWRYLRQIPAGDRVSSCQGNLLSGNIGGFKDERSSDEVVVPVPGPAVGMHAVLMTANTGNWPSDVGGYPTQIFEAIRDLLANVLVEIVGTHLKPIACWAQAEIVAELSDDNSSLRSWLLQEGISPASWASRYARCRAIREATSTVRITQQAIVNGEIKTVPEYRSLVDDINKRCQINWDGLIRPYDLLQAFGGAIASMSANSAATGISLLCSTTDLSGGYNDPGTAQDISARLKMLLQGMVDSKQVALQIDPARAVDNLFHYRRVALDGQMEKNHSKVVNVDDSVMYVGSDNAYPAYLEEFGYWVDDQSSIGKWRDNYWNNLWSTSVPA